METSSRTYLSTTRNQRFFASESDTFIFGNLFDRKRFADNLDNSAPDCRRFPFDNYFITVILPVVLQFSQKKFDLTIAKMLVYTGFGLKKLSK